MPKNVFGSPIPAGGNHNAPRTEPPSESVKAAAEALNAKNANRRADIAKEYVMRFKNGLGNVKRCTLCFVYNATGSAVTLVTTNNWNGSVVGDGYPQEIDNGQWGAFLHVTAVESTDDRSAGAVVYRGQNEDYKPCDFLLAWHNGVIPNTPHRISRCYTEIAEQEHYTVIDEWSDLEPKLKKSGRLVESASFYKCEASVKIDNQDFPVFEAILSLKGAGETLNFHFPHTY